MNPSPRPLALVTGASSGIGFHLARLCAQNGHDLVIAADQGVGEAAAMLTRTGASVQAVTADLATLAGVDAVLATVAGRRVDALLANAGHGLGRAFLDQSFDEVRSVIDTNVTGTLYLIQQVGRGMRAGGGGRILITGSVQLARRRPDFRPTSALARPDDLAALDGFIFGSPTYLGGVSAPFKAFMDATGRLWRRQDLRGKLAAGVQRGWVEQGQSPCLPRRPGRAGRCQRHSKLAASSVFVAPAFSLAWVG